MSTWEEFTQEVSMHGMRIAGNKKFNTIRRIIWVILTLICIGYFCWSFILFLIDYSNKLTSTKVKVLKAKQLKFPTVTICNRNMWAKTAVLSSGFDALPGFMADLHSDDPYTASLGYNYSLPGYDALAHKSSEEAEEFLQMAALSMEVSILECYILERKVNCTDIVKTVSTDGGYCFQFNSDGKFNSTSAGRAGGVSFLLNANIEEYFTGPTSMATGFTLTFHEAHQVPMVTELGIGVSPGTQSSVVLHKSEMSQWPPPADNGRSDCFDTLKLDNPLHYYKNYTYSACMVECKAAYVLERCGCRHIFQPALNGSTLCNLPIMLNCSAPAMQAYAGDEAGLASCDCPDPCIDSEFSTQVSGYAFPSENFVKMMNMSDDDLEFFRKNMMFVDIFYGKMSVRKLEETVAYGFRDLLSNLGGTLGLCVGASFLTMCEVMEFGIIAFSRLFKKDRIHSSTITVAPAKQALS